MKLIKHIQFLNIFFDLERKIFLYNWENGNDDLGEKDIKEICLGLTDIIKVHSPIYFIADDSKRKCAITVGIQNWIATTIKEACISVGLKLFAVIVPEELISHLSTEQTVDEAGQVPFEIKYFISEDEALIWIKNFEKA